MMNKLKVLANITFITFAYVTIPQSLKAQDINNQGINTTEDSEVIIVRASKIRGSVDTRYYDIKTNPDAKTITAEDVVTRLPGAIKDINGKISILGRTNISYQLDGSYFPQDLATQIPASQIERIEVTTNPGAKSSSGDEIIINLISNKKARNPQNILLRITGDTLKNINVNANYDHETNNNKYSFFSFMRSLDENSGQQQYEDYINDGMGYRGINQTIKTRLFVNFFTIEHTLKNNSNKLLLGMVPTLYDSQIHSKEKYSFQNDVDIYDDIVDYKSNSTNNSISYVVALSNYGDNSKEKYMLQFDAQNKVSKNYNLVNNQSYFYETNTHNNIITLNIDNEYNIDGKKFEYGYRHRYNDLDNIYYFEQAKLNNFRIISNEDAAYIAYNTTLGKFDIKPGLRYEIYNLNNINNYRMLLPSIHFGIKFRELGNYKISFARKSQDINYNNFNPNQVAQKYNIFEIGNKNLINGTIDNYETSYEFLNKKFSFLTTIYWRNYDNNIENYFEYGGNNIYYIKHINIKQLINKGINLNFKHNISDKLDYSIDLNFYNKKQEWYIDTKKSLHQIIVFDWKLNSTYRIDKDNSILFMVQQSGKNGSVNSTTSSKISSSIKYTHDFRNNLSMDIAAIDFLSSNKQDSYFIADNYKKHAITTRSNRAIKITLAHRF